MKPLYSQAAFISGGSRGIGLAIAKQLASDGADVMISGRDSQQIQKATDEIEAQSSSVVRGYAGDLATLEGCEAAFAAHQGAFQKCNILIHSAGATRGGVFPNQPDSDYLDGFALKFHAGVRLSRLFWPTLKVTSGSVIMIIGSAARTPDPKFMVGGSVNAALANYTKALAGQGLIDDVNVNWIHPGQTETDRLTGLLATRAKDENKLIEDVMKERIEAEGIRRLGQPEDISGIVAFLCRTEARHIHGTGISVDGGATKGYF